MGPDYVTAAKDQNNNYIFYMWFNWKGVKDSINIHIFLAGIEHYFRCYLIFIELQSFSYWTMDCSIVRTHECS